jgi:hypothetical protein
VGGKWLMADVMFGRVLLSGKRGVGEEDEQTMLFHDDPTAFETLSSSSEEMPTRNPKPRAEKTGTHVLQHLDLSHQPFQPVIILTFQLVRCPRVTC